MCMEFGGGVDIGITRHLAFRVVQVTFAPNSTHWMLSPAAFPTSLDNRQNTMRYSTDIVLRF